METWGQVESVARVSNYLLKHCGSRRSVETWGQVGSVARFFKLPVGTLRGEWPLLRAFWRATLAASCSPPIFCKRLFP